MKTLKLIAAGFALATFPVTVSAQTDRSQADAPGSAFNPVATQSIDTTLPGAAVPSLPHRAFTASELNKSSNPSGAASQINPSELRKNQLGRSWRNNPYPNTEVYVTPLSATIPNSGGNARASVSAMWDQMSALAASVPRQNYLRQAGPALNSSTPVIVPLNGGTGDEKFFRASFQGELRAQLISGTAKVDGFVNLQVTAFRKLRNFARFEWRASAPPGQNGPFSGTVDATVLGRKVKTWSFADNKPIKQGLGSQSLTDQVFFFNGSYNIPWLNNGLAFGTYIDRVNFSPKIGVIPSGALVEVVADVKTRAYAEYPVAVLWYGAVTLSLRLDSDLLTGEVRAGNALTVTLQDGRGYLKDTRYVSSSASAGGGVLKLKLSSSLFKILSLGFGKDDYTLAKILDFKGYRLDQTLTQREQVRGL